MKDFPTIYCIVLQEERRKREAVEQYLELQKLPAKFVTGIQGESIGLKPTNPYQDDDLGNGLFIHNTVVGHFLSYRSALTTAIANGDEDFIVIEDNIEFVEGFKDVWKAKKKDLPADTDLVQLQYYYDTDRPDRYVKVNDSFARCYQYPFQTGAIYWKRGAAQKAVTMMRPVDRPLDVMFIQRVYPFLNHYIADPALAKCSR